MALPGLLLMVPGRGVAVPGVVCRPTRRAPPVPWELSKSPEVLVYSAWSRSSTAGLAPGASFCAPRKRRPLAHSKGSSESERCPQFFDPSPKSLPCLHNRSGTSPNLVTRSLIWRPARIDGIAWVVFCPLCRCGALIADHGELPDEVGPKQRIGQLVVLGLPPSGAPPPVVSFAPLC